MDWGLYCVLEEVKLCSYKAIGLRYNLNAQCLALIFSR